jgi:hypothetical protein
MFFKLFSGLIQQASLQAMQIHLANLLRFANPIPKRAAQTDSLHIGCRRAVFSIIGYPNCGDSGIP